MRVMKSLLAAASVLAVLSCPLLSASAAGYLSRSVEDVPPLAVIDSGISPDVVPASPAALLSAGESLPSAYDSEYNGYITVAKDQRDTDTCWAFSTIACAEADAVKNLGFPLAETDFSEWALTYFLFNGEVDPLGGLAGDHVTLSRSYMHTPSNLFLTVQSLSNWKGIHEEAKAPLSRIMSNYAAGLSPALCYDDVLHLENAYFLSSVSDRDKVKSAIMEHGAVSAGMYYYTTHLNLRNYAYYNSTPADANHAVTLIGWDDNFSRLNFPASERPAGDGAWLVKNSWGETFSNHSGFFWISYYDVSLCEEDVTVLDFALADNFDHNYQYDGAPGFATLDYPNGGAKIAAMYTAVDNELLEAGSLFHYAATPTDYTMDVYRGLTSSKDPTSGQKVATVSGSFPTSGLYTVRLPQAVELAAGDTFSLVFTLSCERGLRITVSVPGEYLLSDGSVISENSGVAGQGMFLQKGMWKDMYTEYNASPRIHAYSVLKERPTTTAATTTMTAATPTGEYLWGDANSDGTVNMKDVLAVRKFLAGLAVTVNAQNADVTPDGAVNMKDVLTLRKFLAGLPL